MNDEEIQYEIIDANEARKRTKENIDNFSNQELNEVMREIAKAINQNQYIITFAGHLTVQVISMLRQLGYHVVQDSQYNEPYSVVSWEEKYK